MDKIYEIKKSICSSGQKLHSQGLSPGASGNISCKYNNEIFISPSGKCLGELMPEDIATIDLDGNVLVFGKVPSSEKNMHLAIYRARTDISAIVHSHPPKASAFAVSGISLSEPILSEAYFLFGAIPVAEYAMPSSDKLADIVAKYAKNHEAILLANHGVVVLGKNITEAQHKLESLEQYAEVYLWSKLLGHINVLSESDKAELDMLRHKCTYPLTL